MDNQFWQLPYFTGNNLTKLVEQSSETRKALIEGLIYEHTASVFYGDDGSGKSLILFQAICEASCGLPVFKMFEVPRPLRTLWIQAERHPKEIGERLSKFSETFKPDINNIVVTDKFQGLNLKNPDHQTIIIKEIDKIVNETLPFDLIVIDPIYSMIWGDISTDDSASAVTRFSTILQNKFQTTVIMIHHTNRGARTQAGDRTEGDFYGNRFLMAHFSGIFKVKLNKTKHEVTIDCEKDSLSVLTSKFKILFDMDTFLCSIDDDSLGKTDKVANLLRLYKNSNKEFTLDDILRETQVSPKVLYRAKKTDLKNGFIFTGKLLVQKKIYRSELV